MDHVTLKKGAKYFFIIFFLLIILISFFMLRPFINAIFISVILAYIFFPIYKIIRKFIPKNSISSFLMIVLVLLIVIIPSVLFIQLILQQFRTFSVEIKEIDASLLGYVDDIEESLNLPKIINLELITEFIKSIPFRLLEVFIIIFILFYLFRDCERLLNSFKENLPIKKVYKDELFAESEKVT